LKNRGGAAERRKRKSAARRGAAPAALALFDIPHIPAGINSTPLVIRRVSSEASFYDSPRSHGERGSPQIILRSGAPSVFVIPAMPLLVPGIDLYARHIKPTFTSFVLAGRLLMQTALDAPAELERKGREEGRERANGG